MMEGKDTQRANLSFRGIGRCVNYFVSAVLAGVGAEWVIEGGMCGV